MIRYTINDRKKVDEVIKVIMAWFDDAAKYGHCYFDPDLNADFQQDIIEQELSSCFDNASIDQAENYGHCYFDPNLNGEDFEQDIIEQQLSTLDLKHEEREEESTSDVKPTPAEEKKDCTSEENDSSLEKKDSSPEENNSSPEVKDRSSEENNSSPVVKDSSPEENNSSPEVKDRSSEVKDYSSKDISLDDNDSSTEKGVSE